MAEYIDIDAPVVVTDTRGRERETTVRHILKMNKGVYTAADVRPVVRGEWQFHMFAANSWGYECRVCHTTWDTPTNYCPNCGADMREES